MIFWREEWLRKVDNGLTPVDAPAVEQFRQQLIAEPSGDIYRCQASELLKVTHLMPYSERVQRHLTGWREGNYNVFKLIRGVSIHLFWAIRTKLFGRYVRGPHAKGTPTEALNLQAGEWVQVKPLEQILKTLDGRGLNRGLYFSLDMRHYCGRKLRVKSRLDNVIADGTGKMHHFRNTVALEGSICDCDYVGLAMGDCARREVTYWREIWLQRCEPPSH
jgi:hypothetical protein